MTIAFEARIVGGTAAPTPEATEIVAYAPEHIPWPGIAFKTTHWALARLARAALPGPAAAGARRRDVIDLGARADEVIRRFYRTFAESVGGRVVERDGVVACIGVHPSPIVTNTAWRADPSADPATVLRVIDEVYAAAGFVGSLLTSARTDGDLETAATASGRRVVAALPVMTVDRATFVPAAAMSARLIDATADLDAVRTILIDGFFEGDPDGRSLIEATFTDPATVAGPDIGVFLADVDGRPGSVAGAWIARTRRRDRLGRDHPRSAAARTGCRRDRTRGGARLRPGRGGRRARVVAVGPARVRAPRVHGVGLDRLTLGTRLRSDREGAPSAAPSRYVRSMKTFFVSV